MRSVEKPGPHRLHHEEKPGRNDLGCDTQQLDIYLTKTSISGNNYIAELNWLLHIKPGSFP